MERLNKLDTFPCRFSTGELPMDMQALARETNGNWVIFNAPRPIIGNFEARGDFLSGVFYAAVDLSGHRADWMIQTNKELDAVIVIPCDYAEMEKVVMARMNPAYLPLWKDASQNLRQQHVLTTAGRVLEECRYREIMRIINN